MMMLQEHRKEERKHEKRLIDALNKHGLYAFHVDCHTDGFPDIIAFGDRTVLIEMKDATPDSSIIRSMEPSQIVFHYKLHTQGLDDCYVVICHDSTYYCYQLGSYILFTDLNSKSRFYDLPLLFSGDAHETAEYMKERACR